jgi:rhodanese-related sulfurtransferase
MIENSYGVVEDVLSKFLPVSVMPIDKLTSFRLKSRSIGNKSDLSIIDIRDPAAFNREHLIGAISVPFIRIGDLARSALPRYREIYIYGESDEQSLHAAKILLSNGFMNVAQIIGGLPAWREIVGATENISLGRRHSPN